MPKPTSVRAAGGKEREKMQQAARKGTEEACAALTKLHFTSLLASLLEVVVLDAL